MQYIFILLFSSMLVSQTIDQKDLSIEPLRSILESASRTNQKVFVEDFTATDWCPYCGTGSLAMSALLDDFPETLITIQWQVDSDTFNENDCQYESQGDCLDVRSDLYSIEGIPTEVFNGSYSVVGTDFQDLPEMYNVYDTVFQNITPDTTFYELIINGTKDSLTVDYAVKVTLEIDTDSINQNLHIFIVEDSISATWSYFNNPDTIAYARNVVRMWSTHALAINGQDESQTFEGSFVIDDNAWNPDHIKITAIVQNDSTNEVYQAAQQNINSFTLQTDNNFNIPNQFTLHQNYPNPFNPVTTLRYDLAENGLVNITIYDMLGREVKTLVNQTQDAGYRSVIWDATNDYGKPVSAGIYLYQIQAGEYMQTKKMVLLK